METEKNFLKGDKYIWGIFLFFCIISIVEMFSASSTLAYKAKDHFAPLLSHITHIVMGLGIVMVFQNVKIQYFKGAGRLLFTLSVILLIAVWLAPGVNDAKRWLFGFQPSEVAKFALISEVCRLLALGQIQGGVAKKAIMKIMGFTAGICVLIAPHDLSTAVLIGAVVFCLMFIGRVQVKYLFGVLGAIALVTSLLVAILLWVPEDHLMGRMLTWKNRFVTKGDPIALIDRKLNDPNSKKYDQVIYGQMAVANGGLMGTFLGRSQIRDFIPQAYSDYIYSIIIEEMGLILGGVGVMFLYFFFFFRVGLTFRKCKNPYPAFLILGISMLIVFQALINMAVGVNLIPVTGQPLPLLSRGGSSIMVISGFFGIILSISRSVGIGEQDYDDYQLIGESSQPPADEIEAIEYAEVIED